ncbi:hypothetical protein [Actinacidiphila sp. ITFR-21]|uniref:hypothetical protein n=1 Tax=Actinacidiphila sp. ITFR-21 TaxID=3075199 RepID=UPI00288BCDE3|nr:hypothetical protein [Streptomyces sp. ITFR-21]WNI17658.1 hypothetical protein RLT57_20425 [Streptomyces sp. ITFR-21]WNI17798.1 hypothetical protein RLT57_21140 [Streptomyces sp. ITFR-21]
MELKVQTPLTGTNLTRLLNDVRSLRVFSIDDGYTRRRTQLKAVHADAASRLAWIETHNGTWRLPQEFLPWALEVDDHALAVLGHGEVFPCTALFERLPSGPWEVEIFPGENSFS